MGKRQDNLLAKIAALTGKSFEEVKEVAAPLSSEEENAYEAQSVLNFFEARIKPRQELKEKDADYERRFKEWQFKTCKQCKEEFAYAYTYDGVAYCSFSCIEASLKEIGIVFSRHDDSKRRWSFHRPAIVSSEALQTLRSAFEDSAGAYDVPVSSLHPTPHLEFQTDSSEAVSSPPQNIPFEQDIDGKTA